MKKKLAGLLAGIMVLAMGTTVFAAGSPAGGIKGEDGTTVTAFDEVEYADANAQLKTLADNKAYGEYVAVVDIVGKNGKAVVTIPTLNLNDNEELVVLHWHEQGGWHVVKSYVNGTTVTIESDSFSPFAFFIQKKSEEPKNPDPKDPTKEPDPKDPTKEPEDGQSLPVLPILAVACLAGVVVCGKKVKFNA